MAYPNGAPRQGQHGSGYQAYQAYDGARPDPNQPYPHAAQHQHAYLHPAAPSFGHGPSAPPPYGGSVGPHAPPHWQHGEYAHPTGAHGYHQDYGMYSAGGGGGGLWPIDY